MNKLYAAIMPALFCANLIMLGASAGQNLIAPTLLFAAGALGSSPLFQQERWTRLFCPPAKQTL